jgi:hypothetical protein
MRGEIPGFYRVQENETTKSTKNTKNKGREIA